MSRPVSPMCPQAQRGAIAAPKYQESCGVSAADPLTNSSKTAAREEMTRRWAVTHGHLEERTHYAAALSACLEGAAQAWRALLASTEAAARCAPEPLDAAVLLTTGALASAAGLEMSRLGLPLRPCHWSFASKPIPALANQLAAANAIAMRQSERKSHV